ncbi:MAG: HAD hydrolase-like protein, partial [Candidatus Paceibacterota bacterium]
YIDQIEVISGAVDFIKLVKRMGYFICIVSNCNRDTCINILKYLKIYKYCNYVIIGNECSRPKPYPDPYLEAINLLKTVPERCIIFEDSKPGLLSAKSVSPRNIIGINNGSNLEVLKIFNLNLILDGFDKFCIQDCEPEVRSSIDFGTCGLNSSEYNLDMLVNAKVDVIANITDIIFKSLANKYSIKKVHLNMQKLKGGYISDVIEITLELNDNTSIDCVLKYENDYKSTLTSMAYKLDLYEREYYFYESISPYINICVPKYIGTVKDSNFVSKGILLENIKREDFVLSLNLNQESIDVSLKVIEQCAKFHALFWNKDLSKSFNQLKKHNDPIFNPHWNDFIQSRWEDFSKRWNYIIKQDTLNKMQQIVNNFSKIQEELSTGNLTLCHGDVKSGNIFYRKNIRDSMVQGGEQGQGGDTYMPYFIDWQYIAHGKGVQDIVFFMIESFDIQHIAEYGDLFKKYYYIKLREYGVTDYSLDDYNKDFNNAICYFPLFVAIWFGTTPNDDLIDVTFPFLFIQKLVFVIEKFL